MNPNSGLLCGGFFLPLRHFKAQKRPGMMTGLGKPRKTLCIEYFAATISNRATLPRSFASTCPGPVLCTKT
jgi:hypothetical protein